VGKEYSMEQGVNPKDLSHIWAMFGNDPFILGDSGRFSSRDYIGEKTNTFLKKEKISKVFTNM